MTQRSFAEVDSNFPRVGEKLTEAEFAAYIGRDQSTVSKWITGGVLTPGADGQTWLRQILNHLSTQAAGRVAATDGRLNLDQEKALLARQQREKIAFELRRQREEFIPTQLACEALTTCNVLIKGQLLNLAHKLKSLLPEIEPKRVTILDEQIRATLSNLGQLRLPAEFLERLRAWQVEGKEIPGHEKTTAPQKRNGISEGTRDKREAASKKTRQDSKKRGRKLTQRTGQGVGNLPPAAAPGKKGDRQTTESQSQGPKT